MYHQGVERLFSFIVEYPDEAGALPESGGADALHLAEFLPGVFEVHI